MFYLIIGGIMTYAGYMGRSPYSAILLIEGIVLVNYGVLLFNKRKSIAHL